MTPDQQRRVRDLFEEAVDRDRPSARAWLEAATNDAAVRDEVLSLLDHDSHAGGFLVDRADALSELIADAAADTPLEEGAVVGDYRIIRELGRGGMGRVYLASDQRLGRRVALKALAPQLVDDPGHRERLRREARAAAALAHPGICTVYALEEIGDALYIASEFVDGRTLRAEIASGPRPSADDIMRTARELAAALAAAHARGVVHRDLKPENVMRAGDGQLKILDFGLARLEYAPDGVPHHTVTQPGMIVGTPGYMAPEQLTGSRVDSRADVFAFGVLVYEYASGVHPFGAANAIAVMARVFDSDVAPLATRTTEVGRTLSRVVARCLQKAPADRYSSASDLLEALTNGDSGDRETPAHATWWRTHQTALVGLYVVAGGLAWWIKQSIRDSLTLGIFLALGAALTVAGMLRGHLLFTERMNARRLMAEIRRAGRALLAADLFAAALLVVDGLVMARVTALAGLVTIGLGVAVGAAALVMEPATTAAAFGDERVKS